MAPKRGPTCLIELRRSKDGRFYLKLTLDDSFDGCVDIKHWYEGEKVRVQVKEHNNDGYEADTEEASHNLNKRTTLFSFKYHSDAVCD